jgi:hypothetical protein
MTITPPTGDTPPLTDEFLDEIRALSDLAIAQREDEHAPYLDTADSLVLDVPRLLAEVDRLRAVNEALAVERGAFFLDAADYVAGMMRAASRHALAERDEARRERDALAAKLAAVQKVAADWRYDDISIVRELIEAVGFTTCFAAYGQSSTLCGETLPRRVDWDFGTGDYSSPALTTRRAEATCPKCRAALGETGGTDER